MNMKPEDYQAYAQSREPRSPILRNCLNAFWVGGLICTLGQLLMNWYSQLGLDKTDAGSAVSMTLVALAIQLTGFSLYDNIAKLAGAGTLVPITGFANSVASPAIEFRSEKIITGTCVKLFSIAGPVLVFGISASILYGLIYWLFTLG